MIQRKRLMNHWMKGNESETVTHHWIYHRDKPDRIKDMFKRSSNLRCRLVRLKTPVLASRSARLLNCYFLAMLHIFCLVTSFISLSEAASKFPLFFIFPL
jgi:hypothetical protein